MKLNKIDIKKNQLLIPTIIVLVSFLLFGSSIYNHQVYGHNLLEMKVLLFWH
jgi:hypothetical protein